MLCFLLDICKGEYPDQGQEPTQDREAAATPLLLPEKPVGLPGPYIEVPLGLLFAFSTIEPDLPPTVGPVPIVAESVPKPGVMPAGTFVPVTAGL